MLDIYSRHGSAITRPIICDVEFLRVDLSSAANGKLFVALTATTVDDDEPQLIDQEIASEQVTSLDDVISLIRAHVRITPAFAPS